MDWLRQHIMASLDELVGMEWGVVNITTEGAGDLFPNKSGLATEFLNYR